MYTITLKEKPKNKLYIRDASIWLLTNMGLPGDAYTVNFTDDGIRVNFVEEKDAIHFSLVWQ